MTSPLPSVEQIQKVMQEVKTCPLIAYYMIIGPLPYLDAGNYYQKHNRPMTREEEERFAKLPPKERALAEGQLITGLDRDVVEYLMQIPYDDGDFFIPSFEEVKRVMPANPSLFLFMHGFLPMAGAPHRYASFYSETDEAWSEAQ